MQAEAIDVGEFARAGYDGASADSSLAQQAMEQFTIEKVRIVTIQTPMSRAPLLFLCILTATQGHRPVHQEGGKRNRLPVFSVGSAELVPV